jgi:ATP-dependent RNA helicase DHX29
MAILDERIIPYDLILRMLERVCFEDPAYLSFSAAILVFMPGLNEIRQLYDMLQDHPIFGTDAFRLYPLHSSISSEAQNAVFDIPPPGVRKIAICMSRVFHIHPSRLMFTINSYQYRRDRDHHS